MSGLQAALAAESLHEHTVVDEATGFRYIVVCANCDNRKCMACVCREMHGDCEDDCPNCCEVPNHHVVGPAHVYLARLAVDAEWDRDHGRPT